jgi:curved DNA-binding protein
VEFKDYYAIMGVARDASPDDIKRAYRRLARKYHPDVSKEKNAEERFKEIGEAYEVLRDPEKRAAYDQLGKRPAGEEFRPPPDWQFDFDSESRGGGGGAGVHSDFFEQLFGGLGGLRGARGGRGTFRSRGFDTTARVEVTLEEAFHGTSRIVDIDGKRLEVTIPRGAGTGSRIRLTGKGPGGRDLIVVTKSKPHPVFTRRGDDLEREVPVTLREALLGGEVPVGTLKGRVLLKVPATTQTGRTFRLKGQGMPKFKGDGTGDLFVRVRVVLPTDLSDEAKAAAERFLDLANQPDPRA